MITNTQSGTRIDEVAAGVYRINTPLHIDDIPGGFNLSQYLIVDDEPMIFHTGWRKWFPYVSEAVAKVIPLDSIKHVGYSHFEGDEVGAMNLFLDAAPHATPFASNVSLMTSLNDMADRPGVGLADGQTFCTGQKTWQWIDTPHVPHGWDCGLLFEQSSQTLLCGDLFTQPGADTPPTTESEILSASEAMRKPMDYYAHSANSVAILKKLADLQPTTLACQHGSAFKGDGAALLLQLADILQKEQQA
jgi:flavorubredoxin